MSECEPTTAYDAVQRSLSLQPKTWLVTGAAGFIGSHVAEALVGLGQRVVGLDNFSTGHQRNLDAVRNSVDPMSAGQFKFIEGDIRDPSTCAMACDSVDVVLHHAALGSVPRSLSDPLTTNATNITGFLNMLVAARDAKVRRFVYAASSSTYGDHPGLPKVEDQIGQPLSPYAVTKYVNEMYANVFTSCYGLESIGLRYFNVFGPRQDPQGAYAAVIPKWAASILHGEPVFINGDGKTSRDFCYVANAVQANLLAATVSGPQAVNQVYNVAVGDQTTLLDMHRMLVERLVQRRPGLSALPPQHREFRAGDVRHSRADIGKAQRLLGYAPSHRIGDGLDTVADWYVTNT